MAFKMKRPDFGNSPLKQTEEQVQLQPSEHKDTEITGGSNTEVIIDLEDRISFIKEDISNQEGGATPKQNKDLATLKARLAKEKAKK